MAPQVATFEGIKAQIKNRQFAPIYLLHGEEGYYTDELVKLFENIIPEEEKDFNMYVMYAPQVSMQTVMDTCRRYPLMSDYQVVILKEAQAINANTLNQLHQYASSPSSSTIFVISCRGAQAKGKDLLAAIKTHNGVIFESKKVQENNLDSKIVSHINSIGLKIEQKGVSMLRDYIGSDLSRLFNEIDKLKIILPQGATVTPECIERNIGASKDYNNFELISAIAKKETLKAYTIINYFRNNPKNNPTILTVSTIFNYFSNLLILHFTKDKSDHSLMEAINIKWPKQLYDYKSGMKHYNAYKTIEIITAIRKFDTSSKGINSRQNEYDLLQDLIFHIFNAQGVISI